MSELYKLFFELIRVSIGTQNCLSRMLSAREWSELYMIAEKQSLLGVCFVGLQNLGVNKDENFAPIGIPEEMYFQWVGMAAHIQQRNEDMDAYTKDALKIFRDAGFECTNLKGQGIAKLYIGHLGPFRQSGDIDLWIMGSRKALYDFSLKTFCKLRGLTYHHIHFPTFVDVEIEAHSWPSFLSSPLRNKRLQRFCRLNETNEDTPSLAFNRVFILLHTYQHFTRRGVGMRQLLDYYFVLLQGFSEEERIESMNWISALGMKRFTEAMMWMMKDVFGLDEKYLLCEPDETYGRFLLDEVMQTGNMGHADKRVNKKQLRSASGRYLTNLKRDIRIVKICPHEALWEPLWGIFQFVWCKLTQIKYKQ